MCGRYLLTSPGNLIQVLFQLDEAPTLAPRFNAAPSQKMLQGYEVISQGEAHKVFLPSSVHGMMLGDDGVS